MTKADFQALAQFRYQLRRYLRFSEETTHKEGITPLQYLLLLQIKGFPGREWATVAELAERLQAKHHGVVALISRCEAIGLVRRVLSQSDLRKVEVHLTPQGEQCITQLALLHRAELLSLQGQFAVPDLATINARQAVEMEADDAMGSPVRTRNHESVSGHR